MKVHRHLLGKKLLGGRDEFPDDSMMMMSFLSREYPQSLMLLLLLLNDFFL
jgi:hypothetical protein